MVLSRGNNYTIARAAGTMLLLICSLGNYGCNNEVTKDEYETAKAKCRLEKKYADGLNIWFGNINAQKAEKDLAFSLKDSTGRVAFEQKDTVSLVRSGMKTDGAVIAAHYTITKQWDAGARIQLVYADKTFTLDSFEIVPKIAVQGMGGKQGIVGCKMGRIKVNGQWEDYSDHLELK